MTARDTAAKLAVAGALLAVPVVPVVAFLDHLGAFCEWHPEPFDARAWRDADPIANCPVRSQMVPALIRNVLVPGTARTEVEAMLGPTEDVDYWLAESEGLVYVLDCWIDCTWLVIEFDADDRLVRADTAAD